jgi:hypothetical protein
LRRIKRLWINARPWIRVRWWIETRGTIRFHCLQAGLDRSGPW